MVIILQLITLVLLLSELGKIVIWLTHRQKKHNSRSIGAFSIFKIYDVSFVGKSNFFIIGLQHMPAKS